MKKFKSVFTGYKDMFGEKIFEGDILVGKTDDLHPASVSFKRAVEGLAGDLIELVQSKERDFVKWNYWPPNQEIPREGNNIGNIHYWNWKGHDLKSVAINVKKVGSIFKNPELIMNIDQRKANFEEIHET